jgi:uncharacterized protein Yka (UPF0111/DUF47 family)
MTAKIAIVERLGEKVVLLPALIGDAIAANDRIKLRLTLLQEATVQAQAPNREVPHLVMQGQIASLEGRDPEAFVAGARMLGSGRLVVPGVSALLAGLASDLATMLAPLETADAEASRPFIERVAGLRNSMPSAKDDQLDVNDIDELVSARTGGRDSVHLLVMDIHKALNRLAAETAIETLDGAKVHGLDDRDRRSVKAFMRGLNRTAPLAFGHPGLGTTAVRAADRLTIQNDIGATDAHVLVVHIALKEVTITYADVHRPRAKFFIAFFEKYRVAWNSLTEEQGDGFDEDMFYLVTGRYAFDDDEALDRFLEFVGSRIVFLVDWNKARKALQTFVGQNEAIKLLTWAAESDLGHRAFLELGGGDLIFKAVHQAAAGSIPYGVRLDESLGRDECVDFLQHVLRDTSQGLAAGRTVRLIRDEIQADLSRRFETAESSVLTVLVRHLGLSRMLAEAIAGVLSAPDLAEWEERHAVARRAKQIEEKADRLTVSAREIALRIREAGPLRLVIEEVENTTDALEDCAFLLSLVPEGSAAGISVGPLLRLSEIVIHSVGCLICAIEWASRLPQGHRTDAIASLQSIDAVIVAERSADAAERESLAAFMAAPNIEAKALALGLEIARTLETATDHLSHAALALHDRVLEELSA